MFNLSKSVYFVVSLFLKQIPHIQFKGTFALPCGLAVHLKTSCCCGNMNVTGFMAAG